MRQEDSQITLAAGNREVDTANENYTSRRGVFEEHQNFGTAEPVIARDAQKGLNDFRKALRDAFGSRGRAVTLKQVLREAKNREGRDKLRRCYDTLWVNHNLVSMSLYSGPYTKPHNRGHIWINKTAQRYVLHGGWLSTGDANLGSHSRRTSLLNYYGRLLDFINVFVVPHHGSASYFHIDLPKAFPAMELAVAAAGRNPYGHPHSHVHDAFHNCAQFINTSENPASACCLEAEI